MKRIHNTSVGKLDLSRKYIQEKVALMKPHGLYWGVDDEWIEWCTSEMPRWVQQYNFDLEIDEVSIYHIFDTKTLYAFEKEYKKIMGGCLLIDWGAVSLKYKGLEITNYHEMQFSRSASIWFCTWDVNSGCVWDLSAVKSCKRINFQSV